VNYYQEHKRLGLCVRCHRKAVKGRVRCKKHLEERRIEEHARGQKTRPKKRTLGICYDCDRPALPGEARCVIHAFTCRKATATYRKKMMKMGRCRACWAPLQLGEDQMDQGHTKCLNCREEYQWRSSIKFSARTMILS
jgi:hypothetical protein